MFATAACNTDTVIPEEDSNVEAQMPRKVLSPEEQELKNHLEELAIEFRDVINENSDASLLLNRAIDGNVYNSDILPINDLRNASLTSNSYQVDARREISEMVINSGNTLNQLKSASSNTLDNENIVLYRPYPPEDYAPDNQQLTVVSHPIDNSVENIGYEPQDDGTYKEVLVNEEYAINHPVVIIKPVDDIVHYDVPPISGERPFIKAPTDDKIYEVKIGCIYCTDYCSAFFDGDLEIRILRSADASMINADTWKVEAGFNNAIPVNLDRKYVRWAKNGYRKGWKHINVVWDSHWDKSKVQQVMAIYEDDPTGEITISGTAKYISKGKTEVKDKDGTISASYESGFEFSVSCQAKYKTRNDLLGVIEYNRDWFFKTNEIDNDNSMHGSYLKDGWSIRKTGSDFYLTTPVREL